MITSILLHNDIRENRQKYIKIVLHRTYLNESNEKSGELNSYIPGLVINNGSLSFQANATLPFVTRRIVIVPCSIQWVCDDSHPNMLVEHICIGSIKHVCFCSRGKKEEHMLTDLLHVFEPNKSKVGWLNDMHTLSKDTIFAVLNNLRKASFHHYDSMDWPMLNYGLAALHKTIELEQMLINTMDTLSQELKYGVRYYHIGVLIWIFRLRDSPLAQLFQPHQLKLQSRLLPCIRVQHADNDNGRGWNTSLTTTWLCCQSILFLS